MTKRAIIIFQKNAVLGKVKTRLAKGVGNESALEIYQELVKHTHEVCGSFLAKKFLFFSDFIPSDQNDYPNDYELEVQCGVDLGERMKNAFDRLFIKGFEQILIIGTDCPELTGDILRKAFITLEQKEAVIGPAKDGGYYLLGMSQYIPELFVDIPWSSDQVLTKSLAVLESLNLGYEQLETLSDVDHQEDWENLKSVLK